MLMAVDIGNTCISVGIFEVENPSSSGRTETLTHNLHIKIAEQKTLRDTLLKEFNPPISPLLKDSEGGLLNQTKTIAVASVNPGVEEILCNWLKKNCGITPLKVGADIPINIPILVETPEKVGIDRLLNSIAAFQRLRTSAIVVDFGTAITFDVVSMKGEYIGGVIAPGIETSAYALNARAAFLPMVAINKPAHVLGKNTEEAISSGVYWGTVGMIERILNELFNELGYQPKVIATGGDAELIGTNVSLISDIIPHLTLEGIRIVHAQSRIRVES